MVDLKIITPIYTLIFLVLISRLRISLGYIDLKIDSPSILHFDQRETLAIDVDISILDASNITGREELCIAMRNLRISFQISSYCSPMGLLADEIQKLILEGETLSMGFSVEVKEEGITDVWYYVGHPIDEEFEADAELVEKLRAVKAEIVSNHVFIHLPFLDQHPIFR